MLSLQLMKTGIPEGSGDLDIKKMGTETMNKKSNLSPRTSNMSRNSSPSKGERSIHDKESPRVVTVHENTSNGDPSRSQVPWNNQI
jgi:hypothetical protein